MYLYNPVLNRMWKQLELWDGTYTIVDLFDINEALQAKSINQGKVAEYYKKKAEEENQFRGRR